VVNCFRASSWFISKLLEKKNESEQGAPQASQPVCGMFCYRERGPITLQQRVSDENAVSLIVALRGGAKEPSCGVNRGVRHIPSLSIAVRRNDAGHTVAIRAL